MTVCVALKVLKPRTSFTGRETVRHGEGRTRGSHTHRPSSHLTPTPKWHLHTSHPPPPSPLPSSSHPHPHICPHPPVQPYVPPYLLHAKTQFLDDFANPFPKFLRDELWGVGPEPKEEEEEEGCGGGEREKGKKRKKGMNFSDRVVGLTVKNKE